MKRTRNNPEKPKAEKEVTKLDFDDEYVNQLVDRDTEGKSDDYTDLRNPDADGYLGLKANISPTSDVEITSGEYVMYELPYEEYDDVREPENDTSHVDGSITTDNQYQNAQFVSGRAHALAKML